MSRNLRRKAQPPATEKVITCDKRCNHLPHNAERVAPFVQKNGYFCAMYRIVGKIGLAGALLTVAGTVAMAQADDTAAKTAAWQKSITQYIDSQISNGPLKGAVVGVCAVEIAGQAGNDGKSNGNAMTARATAITEAKPCWPTTPQRGWCRRLT